MHRLRAAPHIISDEYLEIQIPLRLHPFTAHCIKCWHVIRTESKNMTTSTRPIMLKTEENRCYLFEWYLRSSSDFPLCQREGFSTYLSAASVNLQTFLMQTSVDETQRSLTGFVRRGGKTIVWCSQMRARLKVLVLFQ